MVPEAIVEYAEELSAKSNMRHQMAAVIYADDKILGADYNRWLGTSKSFRYGVPVWSVHAELGALRKAVKHYGMGVLNGASIYIHRNNFGCAKPCGHCWQTLDMMRIGNISWSNGNNRIENFNFNKEVE